MNQEVPGSVGSGSLTDTPLATPAPLLVTVMVNPMGSPDETVGLSATLAMSMSFFFTMRQPPGSTLFPYTTLFRSVLSTGELAGVAEVVPEVMCTVKDAPEAMS